MTLYEIVNYPTKKLIKWLLRDLGDLVGLTWFHLALAGLVCYSQLILTRGPLAALFTAGMAVVLVIEQHRNSVALVSGKKRVEPESWLLPTLSFWGSVLLFWRGTVPSAVGMLGIFLFFGAIEHGPRDDDNGEPYVVRAAKKIKAAALTVLAPVPVSAR